MPGQVAEWLDSLRTPPAARLYADRDALVAALRLRNPRLPLAHAHWLAEAWTEPVPGGWQLRADPRHELRSPIRYRRADLEACWAQLRVPCLLLHGAESSYMQRAAGASALRRWQQLIPQMQSVAIPEAGHLLAYEQPQRVAQEIIGFVRALA